MTSLDQALRLWLASPIMVYNLEHPNPGSGAGEYKPGPPHYTVKEGWEIESIEIRHEEGWSNDSGTSWPAEVDVVVTRVKIGSNGRQRYRRKDEVYASDDPIQFLQELFALVDSADETM